MKTYDSKLVTFLSNENTILIKGVKEFKSFVSTMKKIGLKTISEDDFWRCGNLRLIEFPSSCSTILIEYNNSKGFCLGWESMKASEEWFGMPPFTLKEILEELKGE